MGVLAFATLLLVTPSVSTAPALAQAFDRAHGAAYPGPLVPSRFAASLVATEDHRFYSEPGFDPIAIGRVIAGRVTGQPDQGGATLYQQLAKMLYTPGQAGVGVEVEQIVLGVKLDLSYSKSQIMRLYADVAYFGHGYYGLAGASCGYFGVTPAGLSWPQAGAARGPGPGADRGQPDRPLHRGPVAGGARARPAGRHRHAHPGSGGQGLPRAAAPRRRPGQGLHRSLSKAELRYAAPHARAPTAHLARG